MEPAAPPASFAEIFQQAKDMEAPLNDRLRFLADSLGVRNPAFAGAVERWVERLAKAEAGAAAPQAGEPMPAFLLPDEQGRLTRLEALIAEGPVALAFHRGHWCPYCRLNSHALTAAQKRLKRGRIVAVTPDRQQFAGRLKAETGAGFPFLIDVDNGYALSLNLAVWVGEEMETVMSGIGVDLAAYQGNAAWFLPIPATFIVGTDGIIAERHIDPDYRRRMEVEALIEGLAKAP